MPSTAWVRAGELKIEKNGCGRIIEPELASFLCMSHSIQKDATPAFHSPDQALATHYPLVPPESTQKGLQSSSQLGIGIKDAAGIGIQASNISVRSSYSGSGI